MKLAPEDDFVLRVVQLSELLAIRHCVFLMGPTGSGRTECYRVGRRSLAPCSQHMQTPLARRPAVCSYTPGLLPPLHPSLLRPCVPALPTP